MKPNEERRKPKLEDADSGWGVKRAPDGSIAGGYVELKGGTHCGPVKVWIP